MCKWLNIKNQLIIALLLCVSTVSFGQRIFWTQDGAVNQVRSANLDGTNIQTHFTDTDGPIRISVDRSNNILFYLTNSPNSTKRRNLTTFGSEIEIYRYPAFTAAYNIAHHPGDQQLYINGFVDSDDARLERSEYTDQDFLMDTPQNLDLGTFAEPGNFFDVAVDTDNEQVYVSYEPLGTIYYRPTFACCAAATPTQILSGTAGESFGIDLGSRSIIYENVGNTISSADMDSGTGQTLLNTGFTNIEAIDVTADGRIVVLDGTTVKVMESDGSGLTQVLSGLTSATDVSVMACGDPTTQVSGLTAAAASQTAIDLNWTNGNGDRTIILAREGSTIADQPRDGITYTANSSLGVGDEIGTGTFVVYNGTASSLQVTGLTAGTEYFFEAFSYDSFGNCYRTFSPAAANSFTQPSGPYSSVQNGDWEDPATWDFGVPVDGSDVIINHVVNGSIVSNELNNLTINASGNYQALSTLSVTGDLTNNGGVFSPSTGSSVNFIGTDHTLTGDFNFAQVTFNHSGTVLLNGDMSASLYGLVGNSGTLDANGFTIVSSENWQMFGTVFIPNGGSVQHTEDGIFGTNNFEPSGGSTFFDLEITVNNFTTLQSESLFIENSLTINPGDGTGTFRASNGFELQGDITVNGTIQFATGSVQITGSNNQTISGSLPFPFDFLQINKTGGTITLGTDMTGEGMSLGSTVIITNGNTINLNMQPSVTTGYVQGRLRYRVDTGASYVFAVGGPGGAHYIYYTLNSPSIVYPTIEFIPTDPGANGLPLSEGVSFLSQQFTEGYWRVELSSDPGLYSLNAETANISSVTVDGETRLLSRSDTGQPWTLNGTHVPGDGTFVQRDDLSGTTIEVSGVAGCTDPATQTSGSAIANLTGTSVDLSWTNGDGSNRIVLAEQTTNIAVGGPPADGTGYTANATFGAGDEVFPGVFVVYDGTGSSFTLDGLTPGLDYVISIFEYNTPPSFCYNEGIGGSNSINFTTPSEYTFSTSNSLLNLSSLQDTQAEAQAAQPSWEILFNGAGAFLQMDSWSITQGAGNDVVDWTSVIGGAVLENTANATTEVGTINPTSIDFTLQNGAGGSGRIQDGEVYNLYIWLNTSLPTDADLQNLVFELNESNITVSNGTIVPATVDNSGATNNMIDVIGTSLSYTQQPTDTQVDQPMTPDVTLEALDENGNLDLDITNVTLSSSGTMTGDPLSANAVGGVITFPGITHTATGTGLQLTASAPGATDAVSAPFNITAKPEPLEHVTSFTVDNVGLLNIDLSWVESTNPQLAEGYLLMGVVDGSPFPAVNDGTPVADNALLSDGFSAINLPAGTTTYTFPDALPAVTYDFIIYPYTNSGTEIDYKTDGTIPEVSATTLPNNGSDIIINPAFTPVATIDYINFTQADVTTSSFLLGSFEIRDGGASGDLDLVPTILQDIGFTLNGPINRIALYDGATELGETLAGSPSFTGLNLTVPDDGSVILDVYCTFNTSVTDGAATSIALNPGSVSTSPGNSGISPLQAVVTSTNGNIDVVATAITITQQPSTSATQYTALAQQPIFEAVDVNGNLDTDFNETFVVGTADPDDLQPVSPPTAFNAGVLDFAGSGFNFEAIGSSTMHVLTDATSLLSPSTTTITVTASPVFITSATPTASTFCAGGDGSITVDGVNPGVIADYTFELYLGVDQSTLIGSPGPVFSNLASGQYNVVGTNINSGATTDPFIVDVLENSVDPVINASGVPNSGCTSPNGSITIDIDGGADPANYTIEWFVGSDNSVPLDPARISADRLMASELEAQDYYIEVTNNITGCTNSTIQLVPSAFVIIDANLVLNGSASICEGQSVDVRVDISGGTGPYSIQLDNGFNLPSYTSGNNITLPPPPADITLNLVSVVDQSTGCTANLSGTVSITVNTPPTVDFTVTNNSSCGTSNGEIDITVGGSSGNLNYELQDDGGGTLQTTPGTENQSFIGLAAGVYNVIIDDLSTNCQEIRQITVGEDADIPVALAGGDATICEGESVTLTGAATGGDGNYSFNWTESVGGSISDPTTQNQTVSPAATTTYSLVVTDGGGCISVADEVVVTVNPAFQTAELVASGPTTICEGETTTLQVNVVGGSGPYSISLSNGQSLNNYTAGTDISISPAITSAITLQAAADNNNCTVQSIIGTGVNIIVDQAPSDATVGPDDTTCDTTYPNLGGNTPAAGTGIWTTTSGATITNPNDPTTSVSNLSIGANEFTWTISNGSCTDTSDESIIITRESAPVSSTGGSSINGPTSLCSDAQGQTYTVTGVTGATSYEWTLPNGFSADNTTTTEASITVNLDQAGSGSISAVATNQCGSLSIPGISITITPAAQVTIITADEIKQLQPITFSYNSTARLTRTNWTFGDGSSSGQDNPEHTFTSSGNFTVTLDYEDEQGCANSVSAVVQVSPLSSVSIKNAVTPNGDDKNDVLFIEGIEDYPSNSVTFLDRWGVEIIRFEGYQNDWDMRIGGSLVPAGNYLCVVELPETGEVIKRTVTVVKGN